MDYDKLIHCLKCCARVDAQNVGCDDCGLEYCGEECQQLCGTAATAISTLQAENAQLRADLEYEREHANAYHEECGQWEAENEKLRTELEKVTAERDAAVRQVALISQPNEPLTLEQLRQMDGRPVWIVDVEPHKWYGPGWAIVDRDNCLVRTVKNWNPVFFERYGERWLAYRRPPEGEA